MEEIYNILKGFGYEKELEEYSNIKDTFIKEMYLTSEEINSLRRKLSKIISKNLSEKILQLRLSDTNNIKFRLLGVKLRNLLAEYKLLEELKQKDIPGDVFLWNPQYYRVLRNYLKVFKQIEVIYAFITENFNDISINLVEEMKKLEIEHITIRKELFNRIFEYDAGIDIYFLKMDEKLDQKKTFSEGKFLYQPIPVHYEQRYICIAAAPINALAVWSDSIRKLNEGQLKEMEKELYLQSMMYKVQGVPYANTLIDFIIKYLMDKYGLDVMKVWKTTEEYSFIEEESIWRDPNKSLEVLRKYGLPARRIKDFRDGVPIYSKLPPDLEFAKLFGEFNLKALEIQKYFKHIKSEVRPEIIEDLLNQGYSIVLHHPIRGATQHAVVVYGYSKPKRRIYIYDQLGNLTYSIPYDQVTQFSRMPAGWTMWGFRKTLDSLSYMEWVTNENKKLINFVYDKIQNVQ